MSLGRCQIYEYWNVAPINRCPDGVCTKGLFGLDLSTAQKTVPIHLHMVLDILFVVGTNLPKAFGEMCNIANETRKNVMLYELAVLTDESYFKRTKLMTNSALEKIEQVPEGFLKSYSPALVGAQTITLLKRHLDGNIELEKDRPDIIAYLALYNILLATNRLDKDHEDAEHILTWYGESRLLGRSPQPRNAKVARDCLTRLMAANTPGAKIFGPPAIENHVCNSISGPTRKVR